MSKNNFLIIGGSTGIGRKLVETLAQSQAEVWALSRTPEKVPALENVKALPVDILSGTFPQDGLPESLQGLVYCPGSIRLKPFSQIKDEEYLEDFQINLLGAVRALRTYLPNLKKSESGASIVLFSTVAVQTGMAFHASVASAKGAVEGLVRSLAAEFAPQIRVNALALSMTDTPMAERFLNNDQKREQVAARHPLRRYGNPDEIAQCAAFLLDARASWITGQIFHLDGGMSSIKLFN